MPEIFQKIIKPKDCVLAFGIPTSKEGFERQRVTGNSDFVKQFKSWVKYEQQVVSNVTLLKPVLSECGVTILSDVTKGQFADLLAERKFDIIILFSHWKSSVTSEFIEFADGLSEVSSVLECIPPDFAGTLDLSVCHPVSFARALRAKRKHCYARYAPGKVPPHVWLYFYLLLFGNLSKENWTYPDALTKTLLTL